MFRKFYLQIQRIEQDSANAVRDGLGDFTRAQFLQFLQLRPCTEERFSLSYPIFMLNLKLLVTQTSGEVHSSWYAVNFSPIYISYSSSHSV